MQYRTGTVNVVNNDATVVGVGTLFTSEVQAGDIFTVAYSNVWYEVASVTDNTHLELSANYAGVTANGVSYVIARDFTSPDNIPYPQQGDIETASLLKRAITQIQSLLATQVQNLGNRAGGVSIALNTGRNFKITLTNNITITLSQEVTYADVLLILVQGGSGNYSVNFTNTVKWKGGISTLSTNVGSVDLIRLTYDNSSWYASLEKGFV